MKARTLNCLSCGAAVACDAVTCRHCGARVATMACPSCFTMNFRESKFCSDCGEPTVAWEATIGQLPCPGCEAPLLKAKVGETELYQCGKCFGFWVDRRTFEQICRNAKQATVSAAFAATPPPNRRPDRVRYVRCPGCRQLMNRVNFADYSGIVVDVCREHGTWFEVNELQGIVHFLRSGGMEKVRERQKAELASARRRLQSARADRQSTALSEPLPGQFQGPRRDVFPEIIRVLGNVFRR